MSQQNILLSCSFTTTKKQVFRMVSWKLGTYQAKCQWKNSEVKATPNDPAWILILTHTTVRSHDYSSSCPTQQTEVNTTGVILCLSWWKTADETASQRGSKTDHSIRWKTDWTWHAVPKSTCKIPDLREDVHVKCHYQTIPSYSIYHPSIALK